MTATNMQIFSKDTGLGVSSKYVPINTANIVEAFQYAGFELHRMSKKHVRNKANEGFQKHLLVFRHPDYVCKNVGDVVPEIILQNSYDGSSAYVLRLGVFRMACANGMIVGTTWESIRTIHVGKAALQKAIDGAFRIAAQAARLTNCISTMQSIQLTSEGQLQFAIEAAKLLLPESAINIDYNSMLTVRREADAATDLWTIFNRVQEAMIRGGVSYQTVTALGTVRNAGSRGVKSIDRNVRLNKELWDLAESFMPKTT